MIPFQRSNLNYLKALHCWFNWRQTYVFDVIFVVSNCILLFGLLVFVCPFDWFSQIPLLVGAWDPSWRCRRRPSGTALFLRCVCLCSVSTYQIHLSLTPCRACVLFNGRMHSLWWFLYIRRCIHRSWCSWCREFYNFLFLRSCTQDNLAGRISVSFLGPMF